MITKLAIVLFLCALFSVISSAPARPVEEVVAIIKNPKVYQKAEQLAQTVVRGLKPSLGFTQDLFKQGKVENELRLANEVEKINDLKNPVKVEQTLKGFAGPVTTRPALEQIPYPHKA
ncbi:hypothetical protein DFH28DRAFT_194348 [Melampsora americana]|nr:hypothetical protein DFH28DRAFT_194348 [Melampsora americana]